MADAGARDGAACWIGELAWRDFYRQIMHRFPSLATGAPFRPETALLQTFPARYKWPDDIMLARIQVGNAVPPRVARLLLKRRAPGPVPP